jgi:hypothetical protein
VTNSAEGTEARSAMETTKQTAENKIADLLLEAFSGARVFQGGGNEILGNDLQSMTLEAATNALQRLYPQFHVADHAGWSKVYEKAQKGAPDALKSVGDDGEPAKNAVCKAILAFIAGGKKGIDIRKNFEGATYGWPGDAVDGGVQVLLVAGLIRAQDEKGQTIDPKDLERKAIGKTMFKVESATVTTAQRIQIRKLLQKVGLTAKQGDELTFVPQFLVSAQDLANRAGGDAPRPARPATTSLDEIRLTAGNEQLLALYNQRDDLGSAIDAWTDLADRIENRLPSWNTLKRLLAQVNGLSGADVLVAQVTHIEQQRQLLEAPDLITPLVASLTQLLREELNRLHTDYQARHQKGMTRLDADSNWQQLEPEQRNSLLAAQKLTLTDAPKVQVANTDEVLATVDRLSLSSFADRVAAIDSRFDAVLVAAAELMEPKAQFVKLPSRTIKTDDDIEAWLLDAKQTIAQALKKGPVILH